MTSTESVISYESLIKHKINLIGQCSRLARASFNYSDVESQNNTEDEKEVVNMQLLNREYAHDLIDRYTGLEQLAREFRDSIYISEPPCIFRPISHEVSVAASLRIKCARLFDLSTRSTILQTTCGLDKFETALTELYNG